MSNSLVKIGADSNGEPRSVFVQRFPGAQESLLEAEWIPKRPATSKLTCHLGVRDSAYLNFGCRRLTTRAVQSQLWTYLYCRRIDLVLRANLSAQGWTAKREM
jgi:hypothetical protein